MAEAHFDKETISPIFFWGLKYTYFNTLIIQTTENNLKTKKL
jgi:hypothetical protein